MFAFGSAVVAWQVQFGFVWWRPGVLEGFIMFHVLKLSAVFVAALPFIGVSSDEAVRPACRASSQRSSQAKATTLWGKTLCGKAAVEVTIYIWLGDDFGPPLLRQLHVTPTYILSLLTSTSDIWLHCLFQHLASPTSGFIAYFNIWLHCILQHLASLLTSTSGFQLHYLRNIATNKLVCKPNL